ncbi:hypothetical protein BGW80DRAFT_696853 [Lactifluus volemus]|nr:hypothetical protein BGW80DRAFT_696853 [Lactifluus volemus]
MRQARPRNRAGTKEMGCTPQSPAPVNDSNYDHMEEDYYSSYYEAVPSDASHTPVTHDVREGGQSLSPPPQRTWEPPRPSSSAVNAYPVSTHTTSKESSPSLMADSRPRRSSTPSTKPRMLTLLIEDRRNGSDELAEVRVRLKFAEGYFWADAIEVCSALQSGPSRIDGPAKLFTMRGKYRQTFLRISTDGEETSQSANLKVEVDKTLSIIVESISDSRGVLPTPTLSSNPSPLVSMGPVVPVSNTTHPLTPMSNVLDLEGIPATPLNLEEPGQWALVPGSASEGQV